MNKNEKMKAGELKPTQPLKMGADQLAEDLSHHYRFTLGRDELGGSHHYLFSALALTVRDRLVERWRATRKQYEDDEAKQISYMSLEFLMGRALTNAIMNLDMDSGRE